MVNILNKQFKVVSVSSNTNSFGLFGVIVMAKDGEAYQLGMSSLYVPKKGDILTNEVRVDDNNKRLDNDLSWAKLGAEIPTRLSNAPESVIKEVWGY